jgi:hypothetical protein
LVSKHLYDSAASTLQFDVSLDADVGKTTAVEVSDVITGFSTVLSVSLVDDDIYGSLFDGSLVNLR